MFTLTASQPATGTFCVGTTVISRLNKICIPKLIECFLFFSVYLLVDLFPLTAL